MTTILTPRQLGVLQAVREHGSGQMVANYETSQFGPPSIAPFVVIMEERRLSKAPEAFDLPALREVLGEVYGVVELTGEPAIGPCAPPDYGTEPVKILQQALTNTRFRRPAATAALLAELALPILDDRSRM